MTGTEIPQPELWRLRQDLKRVNGEARVAFMTRRSDRFLALLLERETLCLAIEQLEAGQC